MQLEVLKTIVRRFPTKQKMGDYYSDDDFGGFCPPDPDPFGYDSDWGHSYHDCTGPCCNPGDDCDICREFDYDMKKCVRCSLYLCGKCFRGDHNDMKICTICLSQMDFIVTR